MSTADASIPPPDAVVSLNSMDGYLWEVIVGGFMSFAVAWGIGANDVANSMATSVGSGALQLWQACVLAGLFNFLGALLLGSGVTETVRKGIIVLDKFDPNRGGSQNGPAVLMTGFLVALLTTFITLFLATFLYLPVSTTHTIIGGLVGVGLAFSGGSGVVWIAEGSGLDKLAGVLGVVLSWIISPVVAGILGAIFFLIVRHTVLRRRNPLKNTLLLMPFLMAFVIWINVWFFLDKGSPSLGLGYGIGTSLWIAAVCAVGVAIATALFYVPYLRWDQHRYEHKRQQRELDSWREMRQNEADDFTEDATVRAGDDGVGDDDGKKSLKSESSFKRFNNAFKSSLRKAQKAGFNLEMDREVDPEMAEIHDAAEKFDESAERMFSFGQIITACFFAFSHGSNDVANAIAPFTSIYQLYNNNGVLSFAEVEDFSSSGTFSGGPRAGASYASGDQVPNGESSCGGGFYRCAPSGVPGWQSGFCIDGQSDPVCSGASNSTRGLYDSSGEFIGTETCSTACHAGGYAAYTPTEQEVPTWILALGGAGIVVGISTWGYRVMKVVGFKLTKITPPRGMTMELAAATTVVIASRIGLPVSTTQCAVGAVTGIGLIELKASTINWKRLAVIPVGWAAALFSSGLMSAIIMLILLNTPPKFGTSLCPGNNYSTLDGTPITCSGITGLGGSTSSSA